MALSYEVKKKKTDAALGECHNESIPRQPPHHTTEAVELRDNARARICGAWEGRGAEVSAMQ